ncbi:MAG TPA: CdaR family protein [Candidatus Limnocylindrales bacterium]|nr:CdaR family protein [Candidatus Limnocylindrales bacterium]
MTRVLGILVHNWPLKLAAVGLATLLYGGLVLSQSSATLTGVVPVDIREQPVNTFLLKTIRPVTEIRYFSPSGVQPIASDFEAWVDLSDVEPGSGPQSVPVQLRSIDQRVTVLGFEPQVVTVDLDRIATRRVQVEVDRGEVPTNLEVGTTTVSPRQVQVIGPASVISRVVAARASVQIQPSGIDVDQDVELVAVDDIGNAVAQVRLEPTTARVTIPVFSDRLSKTLPISPQITGTPAAGFELSAASVSPRFVTVEGDVDELQALLTIDTAPISVSGFSSSQEVDAPLVLPTGVVALDVQNVRVSIVVRAVTASRSFEVGLRMVGARPGFDYTTDVDRVLITVGGSVADLDRLIASTLVVDLDVSALGPGTSQVAATANLPAGVTLVAASPPRVAVTVAQATSSPAAGG